MTINYDYGDVVITKEAANEQLERLAMELVVVCSEMDQKNWDSVVEEELRNRERKIFDDAEFYSEKNLQLFLDYVSEAQEIMSL